MLKRQGLLDVWHDRRIVVGDELDPAIRERLERAQIVLFLASPDFLASEYCYGVEVARAMERHEAGEARVIPVILRPCEWRQAPFGKLLAAPTDARPVTRWPDRDEAFQDVVRAIRRAVETTGSAAETAPARPAMAPEAATQAGPRSSNMRVAKRFTQRDRDDFLAETFDFLERFFENSLGELEARIPDVETRFRRIDADRFTAVVYRDGQQESACTVFRGGLAGSGGQICYSMQADGATNGYNEAVHVEADDQSLYLSAMGMAFHAHGARDKKLTPEGVGEMFWGILIEPLQGR